MRGGVIHPHRKILRGVHRGSGDFQVPGKDILQVRQRLAGRPSEFREGPHGLDLAWEAATEGGGGATSVCHILSGSGLGSPTFWGGGLGFVGGNVLEAGGGTRVFPKADKRT